MYNARSINLLKGIRGTDTTQYVGGKVQLKQNAGESVQAWYTSRRGSQMIFNSIIAHQNSTTDKWEFTDEPDQFSFFGASDQDYVEYACYKDSCTYKSKL